MVMDFMPGGDMISWLVEKEIFSFEQTRFYIAELCLAVASVHAMKYVHRDIKPDNILLDSRGHIKLTDFGLCKRWGQSTGGTESMNRMPTSHRDPSCHCRTLSPSQDNDDDAVGMGTTTSTLASTERSESSTPLFNRTTSSHANSHHDVFESVVGSPGYIAPEIVQRKRYTSSCDWWSVGVICYEMLYGCPPFYSPDAETTCQKILHWRNHLTFPRDRGVPHVAVQFMSKLICDPKDRLDAEGVLAHPFFDRLNLSRIREEQAAFVPQLAHALDTKYFPQFDDTSSNASRTTTRDPQLRLLDPRGVLFADFKFNKPKVTTKH